MVHRQQNIHNKFTKPYIMCKQEGTYIEMKKTILFLRFQPYVIFAKVLTDQTIPHFLNANLSQTVGSGRGWAKGGSKVGRGMSYK